MLIYARVRYISVIRVNLRLSLSLSLSNKISELTNAIALINPKWRYFCSIEFIVNERNFSSILYNFY